MSGIVLDTCLVSEPKRPAPDASVRAWFEAQDPYALYLTTTIIGELAHGIARLPAGRRRSDHRAWLDTLIVRDFAERILVFDTESAMLYGDLVAAATAQGKRPQVADAQIAAVARRHGFAVATHNISDFEPFGVAIVNPWQSGP